jgi:hypothetical protein
LTIQSGERALLEVLLRGGRAKTPVIPAALRIGHFSRDSSIQVTFYNLEISLCQPGIGENIGFSEGLGGNMASTGGNTE